MSLSCFLLFVCLAFLDLFNSQVTQPVTHIASFHHTGDKQQRMITNPSLKTTQVEVSEIFHLEQPLSQDHKLKSRKFFILSRCWLYGWGKIYGRGVKTSKTTSPCGGQLKRRKSLLFGGGFLLQST